MMVAKNTFFGVVLFSKFLSTKYSFGLLLLGSVAGNNTVGLAPVEKFRLMRIMYWEFLSEIAFMMMNTAILPRFLSQAFKGLWRLTL